MKENLKGEWMNRMLVIISVIMLAVPPAVAAAPSGADSLDVVIVFPGAPDLEKEAGKFVVQLTALIAREAGVDPSALHGHFFGSAPSALEYLGSHRDSFIIASLGFFLSHRDSLKLQPLASVEMTAGPNDRYFLVIRKGKYASLDDLKGKTLAGNTLYEDPAFLSKIVFDGKIDVSSYFILKATPRPLSALRQLIEDKLDAVLLDQVQYESLKTLAIFSRIETIFTSPALPDLGVMMVDTPATRKMRDGFLQALIALSAGDEGGKALQSFGVKGFQPVSAESLSGVIRKYEAPLIPAGK